MNDGIQIISHDRMLELVRIHEITNRKTSALLKEGRENYGLFLARSQELWIACDNTRGDCWVEEFENQRDAIKWLWGQEDLPLWKSIGLMKPITYEEAADTLKNSKVWDLMYKHPDDAEIIGKFSDAAHFAAAAITQPVKQPRILTATDILKPQKETDPARASEAAFHEMLRQARERASDNFTQEALTATYIAALAALNTAEPDDNTFLIVDNGSTESYSKDHYLPAPMPRDAYAVPLDAQVITWNETERTPPTEADGLKTAGFREGEVIAVDLQERIDLWPWHHVAKYWRQYPRWTHVPTPAQTITPARKEESNA